MGLLSPLASLFAPSLAKDASSSPSSSSSGADSSGLQAKHDSSGSNHHHHHHRHQAFALGNLNSSTLTRMALAGWATTALAGLVDYFLPSALSSASRSFARRRKPFDPTERFVDTPTSLAALGAASLKQAGKQPPTPCPSVEEYISPTFARNYQGAWKYVVQIPHEGYFTQTIQRSSCLRQKCDFTDGVCHEAPRWVSLLVAEIYYPNAIFGAPAAGPSGPLTAAAGPQLATASSTNQIAFGQQQQQQPAQAKAMVQDPLQMTDSLNNYNHNLNTALYSAATELGLDPTNMVQMQQLANAHNYQLLQRNGLLQQQPAEARMSPSYSFASQQVAPGQTQTQRHYAEASSGLASLAQPSYQAGGDYIRALAAETLRQNPHMSIEDLIKSLQVQQARKKRDLGQQPRGPSQFSQMLPSQPQQVAAQPRSSPVQVEVAPSINELASQLTAQQHSAFGQLGGQQHQLKQAADSQAQQQQQAPGAQQTEPALSPGPSDPSSSTGSSAAPASPSASQVECDGHDKIGCYVVRVYYDWFLVNGSCKCWRTAGSSGQQPAGAGSGGNSFLRRIFTG